MSTPVEKSSGSLPSSEESSSQRIESSSGDSFITPSEASSSSGSGSTPPGSDDGDNTSSGVTPGNPCPDISDITVQLSRIGSNTPDGSSTLCFDENTLTSCDAVVSFVIAPFDEACEDTLIARVSFAGTSKTVAIYPVGGVYTVEWDASYTIDVDLFPCTKYTVTVCIERTLTTPVACSVPDGCCESVDFITPGVCADGGDCFGCTNPHAANYSATANEDDGSCLTCASQSLCILDDTDEGDNCNDAGNGCCDEYCLTAGDCSPSFDHAFTAANGTYYPSCYG